LKLTVLCGTNSYAVRRFVIIAVMCVIVDFIANC